MPGNAMVAATEATLMIAPPLPAAPSGRIARRPCLMPSAVPRMLTSSILRMSSASTSVIRLVISMPGVVDQDVEAAEPRGRRRRRSPSWRRR